MRIFSCLPTSCNGLKLNDWRVFSPLFFQRYYDFQTSYRGPVKFNNVPQITKVLKDALLGPNPGTACVPCDTTHDYDHSPWCPLGACVSREDLLMRPGLWFNRAVLLFFRTCCVSKKVTTSVQGLLFLLPFTYVT